MAEDGFDYDSMVEEAMRSVAAAALAQAAARGLPGDHHFYISFRTEAGGVQIPARLKAQYPDEMTIVIQHQYWNLAAHDDAFEVELAFGGKRERLVVPYAALTGFVDPQAQFGLKFGSEARREAAERRGKAGTARRAPGAADPAEPAPPPSPPDAPAGGEKIVSLDHFRKK